MHALTPARLVGLGLALGLGMTGLASTATADAYSDEILAYRAARAKRLQADTGWLTVAGLFWLKPGENTFGTDPANDFVLPAGSAPARAGVFEHRDGTTTIRGFPGTKLVTSGRAIEQLRMRSDAEDSTDVVEMGRLRFFVIERGGRSAIRMRDLESPMRKGFHGIEAWKPDTAWRVEAKFEPYDPPRQIPIANIIGTVDSMLSPGALVFSWKGESCRLDPVLESPDADQLFVIFKDATSGDETYGAGRFLYIDLPKDGKALLDFNKAYNPPCAFTAFATCPLPPRQNELPIAVRAGEKNYGDH